jgi:hypothetical protein
MIAAQCRQTEGGPDVPGDGNEEYLFSTADIFLVLESQKAKLVKRVQEIPGNTLLNASEHDLVQALVEEFRLDVPVLKENERYLAHSGEVQVEVTGDPRFAGWVRQGPVYRAGNENVIAVPFEGEAEFFKIQPNRYGSAPPRAEIGDGVLLLRYVTLGWITTRRR